MTEILIVDDEPNVLNALRRMLVNAMILPALPGVHVTTYTNPAEALAHVLEHAVDVVIADYRMPGMDGATLLSHIRDIQPDAARLILSACTDVDGIVRAINHGRIFRFISKPWSDNELKLAVHEVLEHRALLVENRRLANEVRLQKGLISRQQLELARLEADTPGITQVRWSEDGGVLLE